MITHIKLLKLAHALGYQAMGMEGLCRGFSAMYAQANCCGELEHFDERLQTLENFDESTIEKAVKNAWDKAKKFANAQKSDFEAATPEQKDQYLKRYLVQWLKTVNPDALNERERELYKQTGLNTPLDKLLTQEERIRFTNKAFNEQAFQLLSAEEQVLYETKAFFEGIALYLIPQILGGASEQPELNLFGKKKFKQLDLQDISTFLRPLALENNNDAIHLAHERRDLFDKQSLQAYLDAINLSLKNRKDVSILFAAKNHSVLIRVIGDNQFEFVDTNHLELKNNRFTSKELTGLLQVAFGDADNENEPTHLLSEFYHAQSKPFIPNHSLREEISHLLRNKEGHTIAHLSAFSNSIDTLSRVKFDSVLINQRNKRGWTPLGCAIMSGEVAAAEHLLQYEQLNVSKLCARIMPFTHAAVKNPALLRKIMSHPSFKPKQQDKNGTPLHSLAEFVITDDCVSMAQELIQRGADFNKTNSLGFTPLMLCCLSGNESMLKLLLEKKARLDICKKGNNALHMAVACGHTNLANLLIQHNINVNQKSKKGETALSLAYRAKNRALVLKLFEKIVLTKDDFKSKALFESVKENEDDVIREFTIYALKAYLKDRGTRANYYGLFNTGYSKSQKIAAAKALLNKMNGDDTVDLTPHIHALTDGRLANLFDLYAISKPPLPELDTDSLTLDSDSA